MAGPNRLILRREFLGAAGLLGLSACTTMPFALKTNPSTAALPTGTARGRRFLVGGYLPLLLRQQASSINEIPYSQAVPGELILFDVDRSQELRLDMDFFAHTFFQSPTDPLLLAGSMKWGDRAGVQHLENPAQSFSVAAPKGCYFFGHGLFLGDGKTVLFTGSVEESKKGVLIFVDVTTGKIIEQMDTGGLLPHEILWLTPDEKVIVAQGHYREGKPRAGRLTYLDIKTGKAETQFESMIPSAHLLSLGEHKLSVAAIDHGKDLAIWYIYDQERRVIAKNFREMLAGTDDKFIGEALSQRAHGDFIIMSSSGGNCLYAWNWKTGIHQRLMMPQAIRGVELVDGNIWFSLGSMGVLARISFDTKNTEFKAPEILSHQFSNSGHIQLIQT